MSIVDLFERIRSALTNPNPAPSVQEHPDGDGHYVIVKEGFQLHRRQGPETTVLQHVFNDVASFAAYLNRWKDHCSGDPKQVDILLDGPKGTADLCPTSSDGDILNLALVHTSGFEAWKGVLGRGLSQRDLYNFLRGYGSHLAPAVNAKGEVVGEAASILLGQLQALKVVGATELKQELGRHGETKLSSASQERSVNVTLPESITLRVGIYQGIPAMLQPGNPDAGWNLKAQRLYDIEILIAVDTDNGPPSFLLSAPGLREVVNAADADIRAYLAYALGEGWLVSNGRACTDVAQLAATLSHRVPGMALGPLAKAQQEIG